MTAIVCNGPSLVAGRAKSIVSLLCGQDQRTVPSMTSVYSWMIATLTTGPHCTEDKHKCNQALSFDICGPCQGSP